MGRPPGCRWQPLGLDADPVPGDPQAISEVAAHLASVARTVDGQVAALRKIACDGTEIGQHADKIRSAALSLTGSLLAVATRYGQVSAALSGWVPDLEEAQSLSIRALNLAEGPYAALNQVFVLALGPGLKFPAVQQDIQDRQSAVRRAQSELEAAQAVLARAVRLRDTQAAFWAAKINQASSDSLTDHESVWGGFDITGGFDKLAGAVGMLGSSASAVLGGVSGFLGGGTEGGALFSSGSAASNADVVKSGAGLARTLATVSDVAARAGVDLVNSEVKIIEDPEYLRYLDSVGACACAPYDLPGEIHLGPASFIDEETLAATLAHEAEHVLQFAAGYVPGSGDLEAMEAAARAAEGPAVAFILGVEL
jgi:hypothetical protein